MPLTVFSALLLWATSILYRQLQHCLLYLRDHLALGDFDVLRISSEFQIQTRFVVELSQSVKWSVLYLAMAALMQWKRLSGRELCTPGKSAAAASTVSRRWVKARFDSFHIDDFQTPEQQIELQPAMTTKTATATRVLASGFEISYVTARSASASASARGGTFVPSSHTCLVEESDKCGTTGDQAK